MSTKHAFLVTGSNAAGKTTTVARATEPWAYGLEADIAKRDAELLRRGIMNIRADNDGRFKGEAQDQRRVLTEFWLSDTPILVIEGTRINTPLMDVSKLNREARQLTVIMVNQSPDVMREHLIRRCAKKGKEFRADYWTHWKLEYEGGKRYPNSFRKHGVTPVVFNMDADYKMTDLIVAFLQERFEEILK